MICFHKDVHEKSRLSSLTNRCARPKLPRKTSVALEGQVFTEAHGFGSIHKKVTVVDQVVTTLTRPFFWLSNAEVWPTSPYGIGVTHSMKHSMYLFVSLFDSLSFMQCSRFCPPNTTGGRRCTLPPNPPPVLTKIRMDSLLFNFFLIFLIFLWSSKF